MPWWLSLFGQAHDGFRGRPFDARGWPCEQGADAARILFCALGEHRVSKVDRGPQSAGRGQVFEDVHGALWHCGRIVPQSPQRGGIVPSGFEARRADEPIGHRLRMGGRRTVVAMDG